MDKIKIAYINVMEYYGGGEIVLKRIIENLDKDLFNIYVYSRPTEFMKNLNCKDCKRITISQTYQLKKQRGFKALLKVIKLFFISGKYIYIMKRENIKVIHSNSFLSNLYFSFWAKLFKIKFIAYSHEIREGFLYKILHRYISYFSDKIICVSFAVKNNWQSHGVKPEKLEVVYNGVPDDFFQHSR